MLQKLANPRWQLTRIKSYNYGNCMIQLCVENNQYPEVKSDWLVLGCFITTEKAFQSLLDQGSIERIILIKDEVQK